MSCCCRALGGRAAERPSVRTRKPPSNSTRTTDGAATVQGYTMIAKRETRDAWTDLLRPCRSVSVADWMSAHDAFFNPEAGAFRRMHDVGIAPFVRFFHRILSGLILSLAETARQDRDREDSNRQLMC